MTPRMLQRRARMPRHQVRRRRHRAAAAVPLPRNGSALSYAQFDPDRRSSSASITEEETK